MDLFATDNSPAGHDWLTAKDHRLISPLWSWQASVRMARFVTKGRNDSPCQRTKVMVVMEEEESESDDESSVE